MPHYNTPEEVEKFLAHHRAVKVTHPEALSPPTFERNAVFAQDQRAADFLQYTHSAEHNYEVARLLFELRIWDYALFCSQQSVENYFKAYIKRQGFEPRMTHSLTDLLQQCREPHQHAAFLASEHAETIAQYFNPFNEIARYPVHRNRPGGGAYVISYPDHMYVLDYFVYRMRDLLPIPSDHASLFRDGTVKLMSFRREHPAIYQLIKRSNINFEASS